jgi:hypothetical protein
MAKETVKRAGTAAVENVLQSFLPQLMQRLDSIQGDIRHLDMKIDQLRTDMYDKFEQNRDLFNELGQRIARVEGRLDEVIRSLDHQTTRMDRQSDKMDQWIERLVRVEMTKNVRRGKRAG